MKPDINTHLLAEQLTKITGGLVYLLPELWIAFSILLVVTLDLLISKRWPRSAGILAFTTLIVTIILVCLQWKILEAPEKLLVGMLQLDRFSIFFKFIFCLAGTFAVLFPMNPGRGDAPKFPEARQGEYYGIMLGLVLGTLLMSMSANLLSVYLSIEFVSICSYILTYFNFDRKSAEAGMKYILFGGVASGLMLYGMSLLYGLTGTLQFTVTAFADELLQAPPLLLAIAMILTISGFLFKLAAIPLHLWAPDVYEGAPTPVVALFSVAPKVAGIAVFMRFIHSLFTGQPTSDFVLNGQWLLALLAIITMTLGNLLAIWQNNAKRMMAYSSIAHSGTLLIGVLVYSELGIQSILFYASIYLFMNFAAFFLIVLLARATGNEQISEYKGMGIRYPLVGVLIIVVMIALTGLPPTAGFTAKLLIFTALWDQYQQTENTLLFSVLLLGLLNTVIALFYYLKIPFFMFFRKEEPLEKQTEIGKPVREPLRVTPFEKILAALLIFPLLLLFFKPEWILNFISHISLLP